MWVTICVGAVIAALLVWSVVRLVRRRKQGACAACPYANGGSCCGCQSDTSNR